MRADYFLSQRERIDLPPWQVNPLILSLSKDAYSPMNRRAFSPRMPSTCAEVMGNDAR